MKSTGNRGVERVDIRGNVDGIQLEPAATKPDSTKADSTRSRGPNVSGWIDRFVGRDPSLPLALAALARDADLSGALDFKALSVSYRQTFLQTLAEAGVRSGPELSEDEVHENLVRSVLPRLADEGWIAGPAGGDWSVVRAQGDWWSETLRDRDGVRLQLLQAAVQGMRAHGASVHEGGPLPGGSVLEGLNLSKTFKRRKVVDDVSVRLQQGEIVGLLGPNGAGKTTTFYLITGLIRPDEGKVLFDGAETDQFSHVSPSPAGNRLPGAGTERLPEDDRRGEYHRDSRDPRSLPGGAQGPAGDAAG